MKTENYLKELQKIYVKAFKSRIDFLANQEKTGNESVDRWQKEINDIRIDELNNVINIINYEN